MDTPEQNNLPDQLLELDWPATIAIEGPVGVGKTTLAKVLAQTLKCDALIEPSTHNPFLLDFYNGRPGAALATQLYFLLQRTHQFRSLHGGNAQSDIFTNRWVADYMVERNQLFAEAILNADELSLYDNIAQKLIGNLQLPVPDRIVLLQASPDILLQRIRRRGLSFEQRIDIRYLKILIRTYNRFFLDYHRAPVLIINTDNVDFVNNLSEYHRLLELLAKHDSGRMYFNKTLI